MIWFRTKEFPSSLTHPIRSVGDMEPQSKLWLTLALTPLSNPQATTHAAPHYISYIITHPERWLEHHAALFSFILLHRRSGSIIPAHLFPSPNPWPADFTYKIVRTQAFSILFCFCLRYGHFGERATSDSSRWHLRVLTRCHCRGGGGNMEKRAS